MDGWRARGWLAGAVVVAAAGLLILAAFPAQAATRFSDDFQDGNANGWTLTGGSWSVASEDGSQVLRQAVSTGTAHAVAAVSGPGSGYPTFVSASVKPRTTLGSTGSVAVLFNAADADNYFYAALRSTVLELGKRQNGTATVLATTPYAATVGGWQRLTIDLNFPGRIAAIAAGTGPGAQVAVSGLTTTGFGNRVGFASIDASAAFDNIRIDDDVAPDALAPSTPGTPVVVQATSSGGTLRWTASTDNVGVTGYEVTSVVPPGSAAPVRIWRTATNSITITDLPARSSWNLHVRAFDAANNFSAFSGTVTLTTLPPDDQEPPTAPGTPVASDVTSTGLTLSWAPSTDNVGVTAYYVYTSTDPILSSVAQTNGATTVTVTGLAPGATYTFVVAAADAARNRSPFSPPVTVTLPNTAPPGCVVTYRIGSQWPGGFQADATIRNTGTAPVTGWRLQWTFPSGQTIAQLWNATLITGPGPAVTVGDAGWNATIASGSSVAFGFNAQGIATPPTAFALNGTACTIG
jgi:chitodextrinase